ncbi:hypothetical protein PV327_005392 [Microctonus hyperodae]|uniref:Uncharacterized protein n=1 Tax=Microctonus hyperodae TaxID=165561 RepID=A0AA39G236_MICHY|nr:hypothetical protein PV327_005392 [Microctonus hyperodae]
MAEDLDVEAMLEAPYRKGMVRNMYPRALFIYHLDHLNTKACSTQDCNRFPNTRINDWSRTPHPKTSPRRMGQAENHLDTVQLV